jgi:SagB-type dehydrogenase family enzyme
LSTPRALEEIKSDAPVKLGAEDISAFLDAEILVPADEDDDLLRRAKSRWAAYGWEPAFYLNWATRDYPFVDYSEPDALATDRAMMDAYDLEGPRPANVKSYPGTPISLPLPDSVQVASLSTALALGGFNVPTLRRPGIAELTHVLFCVAGKIGSKQWPGQGELLRRTAPSGGARHPTELYVVALDVEGLGPGVYHYNVEAHGLDPIRDGDGIAADVAAAVRDIGERSLIECHAVLVFTSLVERSMWRYRDSRSYRVILIDVGHMVMNFRCACETLGLGYFCGQGFDDGRLAALLSVDIDDEPPLMIAVL